MRYPDYKFFLTDISKLIDVGLFAHRVFKGDSLMSLDQFMGIYSANPRHALYHVERTLSPGQKPQVCGMVSFSFLNASTAQALKDFELETRDLGGQHQVENPDVIYLSAIAGDPDDAEARRALKLLRVILFGHFREKFNGVSFLTKPVSPQGLSLLTEKIGFLPCNPESPGMGFLYEMS